MPRWCWRWRGRARRGRPRAPIWISLPPISTSFNPTPCLNPEPVVLTLAELEAIKLVDLLDLTQSEAANKMRVSRGTVWRLLMSARRKIAQALVEKRPLVIMTEEK